MSFILDDHHTHEQYIVFIYGWCDPRFCVITVRHNTMFTLLAMVGFIKLSIGKISPSDFKAKVIGVDVVNTSNVMLIAHGDFLDFLFISNANFGINIFGDY